jgi:hypothetical protein
VIQNQLRKQFDAEHRARRYQFCEGIGEIVLFLYRGIHLKRWERNEVSRIVIFVHIAL